MNLLSDDKAELLNYERPPVTEVVYGISFAPLNSLLVPHLGVLWEEFRSEYPKCEEKPPLITPSEGFTLTDLPPLPRVWFVEEGGNQLIQIQRDRFLHNWREISPRDNYPSYEQLKLRYQQLFDKFIAFIVRYELGPIRPRSAEMSYINHIVIGECIKSLEDVGEIFPDFRWRVSEVPRDLEAVNWQTVLRLPDGSGVLSTAIRSAYRASDSKPVFVFELTARKTSGEFEMSKLWSWFDLAHIQIIKNFACFTDEQVQTTVWGRK